MSTLKSQIIKFGIGGTIGFFIDVIVFYAYFHTIDNNPYTARITAYLIAASCSWAFHHHFTFKGNACHSLIKQWFHFLLINSIGGVINFTVFSSIVFVTSQKYLLIPFIAGTIIAMSMNFILSKKLVFKN